jgi:DNA-binding GntR family transcriptional regulator
MAQWVYDKIWHDLVTWRFRPSDILAEGQLASRFGTSRTPVRESLRKLAEEGFLRVVPRAGYVVLPVTLNDVHEALHLRQLLESEAAALAASALTDEVAEELESWWTEFERAMPESEDDFDAVEASIVTFDLHVQIARASGSRRLADLIETLIMQTTREVLHPKAIGNRSFAVREHRILLEGVLSRDPARARAAVISHLEGHRSRLLEALVSEPTKTELGISPMVRTEARAGDGRLATIAGTPTSGPLHGTSET